MSSSSASGSSRRARLADVARLAGVDVSTASRALTGSRPVGAETSREVLRAAKSLNYRVDPIGRALRRQSTSVIGMVVPDLGNPFFPAVIQAVERALSERKLSLILCDAQSDPQIEGKRVADLTAGRVEALLISPVDTVESVRTVRKAAAETTVIQVDRSVAVSTDVVRVDQVLGVELAITHLREQQCERLAFVTARQAISTATERLGAWQTLLRGDPHSASAVFSGEMSFKWGQEAARRALSSPGGLPDGIVCVNDLVAVGVINALLDAGVRVPNDVAVIGFDDTELGAFMTPALTSVRQPWDQLGREAVNLLLDRLGSTDTVESARQLVLSPELIVRESSLRALRRNA